MVDSLNRGDTKMLLSCCYFPQGGLRGRGQEGERQEKRLVKGKIFNQLWKQNTPKARKS